MAGRGRLGRSWRPVRGASLTFSLALPLAPRDWSGLSLAVGVALVQALQPDADNARWRLGLARGWSELSQGWGGLAQWYNG